MKEIKHIKPGIVDITTFCSPNSLAGIRLGQILTELDDEGQYKFVRRRLDLLYQQLGALSDLKLFRLTFMKNALDYFEKTILESTIDKRVKTFTLNIGKAKYKSIVNPLVILNRITESAAQSARGKKRNKEHEIEKNKHIL